MADFIEFPVYDGVSGDLWQWILWLEDFFILQKFTKLERLNLAQSLLAGQAEAWFYQNQKMLSSWKALRDCLWLRFGEFTDEVIQELSLEKRRKRFSRTAINPQESSSAQELIAKNESQEAKLVQVEGDTKKFQILDSSEEESIHQNQVPVSSLEPGLRFSGEIIDVSVAWPCAIVSHNPVLPQVGFKSVKNTTNAHQLLDKRSLHKERLKPRTKRKLSLSLKTWRFKFKNKNLHHAMDSNIFKSKRSFSSATCGYKWRDYNSRYWRRMRQTHMSRLLCVYQPNADKALEALKEIQSQLATVRRDEPKVIVQQTVHKEASITHLQEMDSTNGTGVDVESANGANGVNGGGDIDALPPPPPILPPNVVPLQVKTEPVERKTLRVSMARNGFGTKGQKIPLLTNHFKVDVADLQGHFYHYNVALFYEDGRFVEAKGIIRKILDKVHELYHSDLDDKQFAYDGEKTLFTYGVLIDNKMDFAVVLENSQEAIRVLDIILRQHAARQGCLLVRQSFFHTVPTNCEEVGGNILESRGFGQLIIDDLKSHLRHKWKSKRLHPISALDVYLSSVIPPVTSANSCSGYMRMHEQLQLLIVTDVKSQVTHKWRLVWRIWRLHNQWIMNQGYVNSRKDSTLELQVLGFQHPFKPGWAIGVHLQVQSKACVDASANSWMFSTVFVHLYLTSKLEDKLVLEGGSIDTIKQSYHRKNKKKIAVVSDVVAGSSHSKEALSCNRGFQLQGSFGSKRRVCRFVGSLRSSYKKTS